MKSAVKCSLLEYNVPECKDFAGYIFKKIFQNFTIVEQQKEFKCEIPTKDRHKPIVRSQDGKGDMKKSPLCDAYKKVTVKSAFEFPCFLKCQTAMSKCQVLCKLLKFSHNFFQLAYQQIYQKLIGSWIVKFINKLASHHTQRNQLTLEQYVSHIVNLFSAK